MQITTEDGFVWMDHVLPSGTAFNIIEYNDGVEFSPPKKTKIEPWDGRAIWQIPMVPDKVDMWQLRSALSARGLLAAADALATKVGGVPAEAWARAPTVTRSSPALNALAPGLGLKDADIDAIFIEAAAFVA